MSWHRGVGWSAGLAALLVIVLGRLPSGGHGTEADARGDGTPGVAGPAKAGHVASPAPPREASSGLSGPALPVFGAQPRVATHQVAFDRADKRADELDSAYERRMRLSDTFERFRRESGIPDHRAQELLRILYDLQENFRIYRQQAEVARALPRWELDRFLYETSQWRWDMQEEANRRLRALLTPAEHRAWRDIVVQANIWFALRYFPMLKAL